MAYHCQRGPMASLTLAVFQVCQAYRQARTGSPMLVVSPLFRASLLFRQVSQLYLAYRPVFLTLVVFLRCQQAYQDCQDCQDYPQAPMVSLPLPGFLDSQTP